MSRDVSGTTKIEVSQGEAIPVSNKSFDPGYSLDSTYEGGDPRNKFTKSILVRGYESFGRMIGEHS